MAKDNSVVITTNMISVAGAARLRRSDDYRDVVLDVATDGYTIDIVDDRLCVNPEALLPDTLSFSYNDLVRRVKVVNGVSIIQYIYSFNSLRMFEVLLNTSDGPVVTTPTKVIRDIEKDRTSVVWEFDSSDADTAFKNAQWYILFGRNATGIPDIPEQSSSSSSSSSATAGGTVYYGYISDGVTYRVCDITETMIKAYNTVNTTDVTNTDALRVNAPEGSLVFIAVPSDGYYGVKDDGVNPDNKIPFDENLGMDATGANGLPITIDGIKYEIAGEYCLVSGIRSMYIMPDSESSSSSSSVISSSSSSSSSVVSSSSSSSVVSSSSSSVISSSSSSSVVSASSSSTVSIPTDAYYGYINDGATYSVTQITEASILASDHKITAASTVDPVTVLVPSGGVLFIAVPETHYAMKDDGVGGQVPFIEDLNIGVGVTGANGMPININDKTYMLYGELSLVEASFSMYILTK